MIYDEPAIGKHPASSGYRLEFFVGSDSFSQFESGSGSFTTEFPEFAVTGIRFEGKEQMQLPTGDGLQLLEDYNVLENKINLICSFSGVLNGETGLGTRNIKELAIFTGRSETFEPDILEETNLVSKQLANVTENSESFTFTVLSDDILQRVEENIFYKVVPLDFLTFSDASSAASGIMFSGFEERPIINTTEYIISRENIRDVELTEYGFPIDIYTGCDIIIDDGLILDIDITFRVRQTNENVTISGSGGALLKSSNSSFPVINNKITLQADPANDLAEFNLTSLLDQNNNRTHFIVSEN